MAITCDLVIVAQHSETGEKLVVYRCMGNNIKAVLALEPIDFSFSIAGNSREVI